MTKDPIKQREYDRQNKVMISIGLMRKSDADIIAYLDDKQKARISRNALIKKALRDQMRAEGYKTGEMKGDG